MRTYGFAYRIALAVAAVQLFLIAAILYAELGRCRAAEQAEFATKSAVLLDVVEETSRAYILKEDLGELQGFLTKLTRDPEIVRARVTNRAGQIIASTSVREVGWHDPTAPEPDRAWVERAVEIGTVPIGTVAVEFDRTTSARDYARIRNTAVLAALLAAGASAVIGIVIGHVITRRLGALAAATQRIAAGDHDAAVAVDGRDEVAVLARVFNRMASNLREQMDGRRVAEDQLRESQRLEALGQLAGGVAHDFNNILVVIASCAESLHGAVEREESRVEIAEIKGAVTHATALTRQLLTFARRSPTKPGPVDLDKVSIETERLLRRTLGSQIQVTCTVPRDLWSICGDPHQIEQLLLNLAINARDAMPHGGTISIRFRNEVTVTRSTPNGVLAAGDYVVIEVEDTGTGIPEDVLPRIFEPLFTTKPHGKGTGLGLPIVFGIAHAARGLVTVDSMVGRGTTFRVYWPRHVRGGASPEPSVPAVPIEQRLAS